MKIDDKTQPDRGTRKKKPITHTSQQLEELQTKVLETEDRFQIIFDNSPDGMVIINPTENAQGAWLIENCNRSFCEMNGFVRSEIIGKDIRVVSNETATEVELANKNYEKINGGSGDGKAHRREYYQRLKQGPIRVEETHQRKNGSTFYIQSSSCLITLNGQERVLGIDRDITERKQTEKTLRESEQRYQSLFKDSPTALWLEDYSAVKTKINHLQKRRVKNLRNYFAQHPESVAQWATLVKVLDVNQAALDLHKAASKEELLSGLNAILMDEALPIFLEEIIALSEGKLQFEGEFIERTLQGDRINVAVKLSVSPGCEETWSNVFVSTVDITERKQAGDALQKSAASLQAVLQSTADGIMAVGSENEVLYANARFAEMWHIPPAVMASKDDLILQQHVLDQLIDPESFLKEVQELYKSTKDSFDTLNFKDGRVFERVSRPLIQGAVMRGRVWSFRDITERIRAAQALRESEDRYHRLVETLPNGAIIHSQGRIVFANLASAKIIGAANPAELIGKPVIEFVHPDYREPALKRIRQSFSESVPAPAAEEKFMRLDGTPIDVQVIAIPFSDAGKPAMLTIFNDITARKQGENLQDAIYRISQAADHARSLDALYLSIHAIIQEVMAANNFYIALYDEKNDLLSFPYSVDEQDPHFPPTKLGKGLTEYILRTGKTLLCDEALYQKLIQSAEIELVGAHSPIWLGAPLTVEGKPIGAMVVQDYKNARAYGERELHMLEFVSTQVALAIERKRLEEEVRSLSLTDELTGLYNRRGFTLLAEQEVKKAFRIKRSMLLLFADVDYLKTINDTWGHAQGDLALQEVSAILKASLRETDILARIGGDEFVVLAVDASQESAEIMTDRLQAALQARNQQKDRTYPLTLSMGVALYDPKAPNTVSELIAQADALMYAHKQARR